MNPRLREHACHNGITQPIIWQVEECKAAIVSAVEKTQTDLDELNKVTVERLGAVKSELTGKIQGRNSNALLNIPLAFPLSYPGIHPVV